MREELRVGRAIWNHIRHERGWGELQDRMRGVREKAIHNDSMHKKLSEKLWQHKSNLNLRKTIL